MTNKCPKCGSYDWDWANIGFTDIVLCTNCGYLYPSTGDRWPFPTIDKPLKPLTPKEVKQYNKAKVQSLGDSPM
jgi:Zn ribbon nucleic-acid-binding protein